MATYQSYDTVGKKEDISDVISNISPTKTPFSSLLANEKIHNTIFQWQEDQLASPNLSNAQIEGFDATETAPVATVMRSNLTQILSKTVKVSQTLDNVSEYGRAKETAYQLGKFSAEVKRDLEAIMLSGQASSAGSDSAARSMASYQAQVDSTLLYKTGGPTTAMAETSLLTACQQLYINGADPEYILLPPAESLAISAYASASGRERFLDQNAGARKIVNVIDVYVSPFGEVKVVLDRFTLATDYLIFEKAMWAQPTLRPWTRETLAKTGDNTKMMIVGEFSLRHKNFFASAIVRKSA